MRRFLTVITLLAALTAGVSTATPALAAEPHHRGLDRLQQQLGLTDDQVQAIREVHTRRVQAQRQLWQQIRNTRREVRDLAVNGGDPGTLDVKTQELAQLFNQALKLRVETLQEIAPILTPEQREKYAQMSPWPHRHPGRHRPDTQS